MKRKNPTLVATVVACAWLSALSPARGDGSLKVSFTTTSAGGNYAPRNVVAVWVENNDGDFVATLGRWSDDHSEYLLAWLAASGETPDAVSGASRIDNDGPLSVVWDMKDRDGRPVPTGRYQIRMELADSNSETVDANNQGMFAFDKTGDETTQANLTDDGFVSVTLAYRSERAPNREVECIDDDGSCPAYCHGNDSDCAVANQTNDSSTADQGEPPNGPIGGEIHCSSTANATANVLVLLAIGLARRRRLAIR